MIPPVPGIRRAEGGQQFGTAHRRLVGIAPAPRHSATGGLAMWPSANRIASPESFQPWLDSPCPLWSMYSSRPSPSESLRSGASSQARPAGRAAATEPGCRACPSTPGVVQQADPQRRGVHGAVVQRAFAAQLVRDLAEVPPRFHRGGGPGTAARASQAGFPRPAASRRAAAAAPRPDAVPTEKGEEPRRARGERTRQPCTPGISLGVAAIRSAAVRVGQRAADERGRREVVGAGARMPPRGVVEAALPPPPRPGSVTVSARQAELARAPPRPAAHRPANRAVRARPVAPGAEKVTVRNCPSPQLSPS